MCQSRILGNTCQICYHLFMINLPFRKKAPKPVSPYPAYMQRMVTMMLDLLVVLLIFSGLLPTEFGVHPEIDALFKQHDMGLLTNAEAAAQFQHIMLHKGGIEMWLSARFVEMVLLSLYFVISWSWKGTTLGKWIFGMHVRKCDEVSKMSIGQAFLRCLGYAISALTLGMGFIFGAFNAKKRGWHDKIASTVVVYDKNNSLWHEVKQIFIKLKKITSS